MATWIVLTDDWELRGNGTGTVERLQQKPALQLMDLYDKLGIKSTFNVEVMQQLAFEKVADTHADIRAGRDAWRHTVSTMISRGFDVQLHLHPQWLNAELIDGWWKLDRRWNIGDYSVAEIERMMDAAILYLQDIIGPDRIVSFRGGSWGMGPPSRAVLTELARRKVTLDVSIVNGNYYDGEAIQLDYRNVDSPFSPYYPDLDDIRRFPRSPENAATIVEIPTQSVRRDVLVKRLLAKSMAAGSREAFSGLISLLRAPAAAAVNRVVALLRGTSNKRHSAATPDFVIRDPFGFQSGRAKSDLIFDLSSDLRPIVLKEMSDVCIARATDSTRSVVVLVFENHTKDLQRQSDFDRIEGLISHIRVDIPGCAVQNTCRSRRSGGADRVTTVLAAEELVLPLRAALQGRLQELGEDESAPSTSRCSDAEAEEMLRKLMVRYRPKLAKGDLSFSEIPALIDSIKMVASCATWSDLRFVDGLNAIYEAWKIDYHSDARRGFLAVYRRALRTLIES